MRYFLLDQDRRKVGPYTVEELHELHQRGVLALDAELVPEDGFESVHFLDLWAPMRQKAGPDEVPPSYSAFPADTKRESVAGQAGADLRALIPHLLLPFEELKDFRWLRHRRMLSIAAVGLLPLILISFFAGRGEIQGAYWAVAFYFSALWGIFFYYVFPAPALRLSISLGCFFGTGFFSISLLLMAYSIPPLAWVPMFLRSGTWLANLPTFIIGVGIPEEFCKVLALLIVTRQFGSLRPQTMLFYGLMSGLGFGIYEGVGYQLGRNLIFSSGVGEYYLLNLIRLTTLPFLHAIWTGIAGYFIGFAAQYPHRKLGLWIVAIGLPAILHGLYNTFSASILGFGVALLSVLVLNLYLAKSVDFARALDRGG